jgi:2',3'-cyclic-nucleotide 2'-phosphodiesterase (5'-nucleotidase family)
MCHAGDFYGGAGAFNEPKSHLVARMMGYLRYDAIAVGEMDLNYGLEKLVQDAERFDLNLTCANVISKGLMAPSATPSADLQEDLGIVFPPYLVVERNGVRFGFVALLAPETKSRNVGAEGEVESMTYIIKDPWEMAEIVLPEARENCDFLILLAHMDQFDLEMRLPDFPEVDLVVRGHNAQNWQSIEPIMVGTVPVYLATAQGQNIGNLRFALDADMNLADTNCKVYFLSAEVPDDTVVARMLDQYEEENKKQQKILFAKEQLKASSASGETGDVYLGVGSCMSCHPDAFEVYKNTRHARAYRTLSAQFVHRDDNCVGCHVTGYGDTGGFGGIRRLGAPVDLIDVQCEACHGPGIDHNRDGSYRSVAVESCARCHTKEQDPDFDYEEAWDKIAH